MNEGNSTGVGIGCGAGTAKCIPDQFWRNRPAKQCLEAALQRNLDGRKNEFLMKLKEKKKHVTGRCATCVWLSVCGGNWRGLSRRATPGG